MGVAANLLLFSGSEGGFMSANTSSFPCTALYSLALQKIKVLNPPDFQKKIVKLLK